MKIGSTLKPGENGTKELLLKYGEQLVCVRYRYDKARGKRVKTVELIVDVQDWAPGCKITPEKLVLVRVDFDEVELRERVKEQGGFWNPEKKGWRLPFGVVLELGLERRLIDKDFDF